MSKLNGVIRSDRIERTMLGIMWQVEDFGWIILKYVESLTDEEMMQLYELEEDQD